MEAAISKNLFFFVLLMHGTNAILDGGGFMCAFKERRCPRDDTGN